MSRYSLDVRKKVVAAYLLRKGSIRQLADQFMLSPATVHSYIKRYRETQDLTPRKPGPTKPKKLVPHRDFIVQMVKENPDWTLRQYSDYFLEKRGVHAHLSEICEFLQDEGLTLKKKRIETRRLQLKQAKCSG
jgi:transposase